MTCRTLLVGGLSSTHDPLLASALRGVGIPAVTLHARTDAGLRRARALGNHGQCNPAHYAVGAVLEHALRSGHRDFDARYAWLTLGSCGPCRLSSFGIEYAQVLAGAGLARLPVVTALDLDLAGAFQPLLAALVAGDILAAAAHRLRPRAFDPDDVDRWLSEAVDSASVALLEQRSLVGALRNAAPGLASIARDPSRVLPRVLVVGEPWTTLADGDPSYDLLRRLEILGVEIEAPMASDWLRHRLRTDAAPSSRELDRRVRALRRLLGRELGIEAPHASEMDDLADLARPHYDPAVLGGSAHLEIGRALRAARDRTAHLVLSIKPFGCLPSSHLSDGILAVLSREGKTPPVLSIETTGSADAAIESRVEMAIHAARVAVESGA